jgi:hypothetical protein
MTTIDVFPNSGHHYTFIPFSREILTQHPKLKEVCSQGRQPWRTLNHAWVRGRFAMRDNQPGLWIAVESNAGTADRGAIYEPRHPLPAPPPPAAGAATANNASPYAVPSVMRLPEEPMKVSIKVPSPAAPQTLIEVAEFEVVWKRPSGERIDVDLIVDFGNTRTVVLALENLEAQNGKLSLICRSIRFLKRGYEYEPYHGRNKADDTSSIVDSWFVLHEPSFASLEPPAPGFQPVMKYETEQKQVGGGLLRAGRAETQHFATLRQPQMFVELSPVVMGDSARTILGDLDVERGGNYSLSSPKRYVWDTDLAGKDGREWWNMVLNRWNPKKNDRSQLPKLAGSMLRFLPADGRDWSIDQPPNEAADASHRPVADPAQATYPRCDAMTWAALGILEHAHRQITSEEWRAQAHSYIPRRLRNVMVTFPSGWSAQESAAYRRKWEKALNIFTLAHLEDKRPINEGGDRAALLMDIDEAVASQLPFVYSEIRRLGDVGENWIELFGRGVGSEARVRLMTVDIGGGTTDISIVEYGDTLDGHGVELVAQVLFRDSSSVAGDALAKEIIQSVLLPSLGQRFRDDPEQATAFENVFSAPLLNFTDKARWSRIVKLVFLPIVRQWLMDLARGTVGNPEAGGAPWVPSRIMGAESRLVDDRALKEFNDFCHNSALGQSLGSGADVLGDDDPLNYQPADIEACIVRIFEPVILSLAKYVVAFEVDLVTLSGKPSELPRVKRLLEELLPILPQRIIQARDFPAGDWYPMSSDGKIHDAKSVTAVGAALYQAIHNGLIANWSIKRQGTGHLLSEESRVLWGAMPTSVRPNEFGRLYLAAGQDEATHPMLIGTRIGRKLFESAAKPEQVYRLRWRDKEKWGNASRAARLNVTLRRVQADNPGDIESLEIADVEGEVAGKPLSLNDVDLQLCTLEDEEFWIDAARFEINWAGNH